MKTIYFDNNATTQVAQEVLEEIQPLFCELYGNPSSMHIFGGQGILYCYESNGTLAWSESWVFYGGSQPLVSDIDNDGDMEIILVEDYVDQDRVSIYDHLGDLVFELSSSGPSGNSPLIIDIDNDGSVELLCPRTDGDLILCEFNATASGRTLWSREKCSTFNIGQVDYDGDHIDDLSEGFFGTDPELLDTDLDNLADWQEIYSCSTDPTNADSDVDGLNDDEEIFEGNDGYVTDPHDNDTDDDLITDGDEYDTSGLYPYITNPTNNDTDGDGLTDHREQRPPPGSYFSNPLVVDTDGDGYDDGEEAAAGTDPSDPDDYPGSTSPTVINPLFGGLVTTGLVIFSIIALVNVRRKK